MKRLVVDIEGNDLLANMLDFSSLPYKLKPDAKLWCVVVRDVDTDETTVLTSESGRTINKEQVSKAFEGVTEVIAHNGIKFDFIALDLFGVLDYEVGYLNKPDSKGISKMAFSLTGDFGFEKGGGVNGFTDGDSTQ